MKNVIVRLDNITKSFRDKKIIKGITLDNNALNGIDATIITK